MASIQAAVMTAPGHIEMRQVELGPIGGSDKHMYAGHMGLPFPIIPGHELVGTIEELGPKAADAMAIVGGPIREGDRITTTPSSTVCGRCHYCLHMPQRPTLCSGRYVHGFVSSDVAPAPRGGFSQYMHLTERSWIFKIPDELSGDRAVLTEPAAVATRAVERALGPGIPHIGEGLGMDQSVLVLGAGPIGQLVIAVLSHIGTDLIIASDLSQSRLEMAGHMGAHHVVGAEGPLEERLDTVQNLTGGIGPDIVGHFTDPGGVDIHPNVVCFKDLDIRGMWAYPAMQFKTALSFLKNSRAPLDRFITHRLPLEETEKGIELTGSEGSMKVVVEP